MKLSNSIRMKLAHRTAKNGLWMLGSRAGKRRGFNTYRDLFNYALKHVHLELESLVPDLINDQREMLELEHSIGRQAEELMNPTQRHRCYEWELDSIRLDQKRLVAYGERFKKTRALYVEIYGEYTEAEEQALIDSLPACERLDGFVFGISNLLHDGFNPLAIVSQLRAQWVYVKPCCNCGSKYGCECGCTCEEYGDHCDCGDDSDW